MTVRVIPPKSECDNYEVAQYEADAVMTSTTGAVYLARYKMEKGKRKLVRLCSVKGRGLDGHGWKLEVGC